MTGKASRELLFESHNRAFRTPSEIFGSSFANVGITPELLQYDADETFVELLRKLRITLLVGREYEHLVLAFSSQGHRLKQTFFHLPHPSGIAYDPKRESVYIASTRNPNQIVEFKSVVHGKKRVERDRSALGENLLAPVRAKFYPGHYYFHDLVTIGGNLFANSVGQNGMIQVNLNDPTPEEICWWPKCVENTCGLPNTEANFIQLNSIAAGETIEESYFSATADEITSLRPGDPAYPVDGRGVVFSGKTRIAIARGLTRPHSARIHAGKVWVNNSGYGEIGYLETSRFVAVASLSGWTRGLSLVDGVAFVGVSRILPKFKSYAPGINGPDECSVVAIQLSTGSCIGKIRFPYGNQIFAIESIPDNISTGFAFENVNDSQDEEISFFYNYNIKKTTTGNT